MNTGVHVANCANCSSPLTAADLMAVACRYCGAALPHQVAAAQQAALVNQLMTGPNSPYQAMANQAMAQAYGAPQQGPYGMPPQMVPAVQMAQAQMEGARRTMVAVSVIIAVVVGLVVVGGAVAFLFLLR